ncbi:hypothetical protein BN1708_018342, partial [Verticillium longisporum]
DFDQLPDDDLGPRLNATVWSLTAVSGLFLGLRLYCKFTRRRGLWLDDHFLIAAVCHLRFQAALRIQGIDRATLPYAAPLQPYLSWFGLFFIVLILLTNGFTVFIDWSTSDFFAAY